jgi:hypothetical protein
VTAAKGVSIGKQRLWHRGIRVIWTTSRHANRRRRHGRPALDISMHRSCQTRKHAWGIPYEAESSRQRRRPQGASPVDAQTCSRMLPAMRAMRGRRSPRNLGWSPFSATRPQDRSAEPASEAGNGVPAFRIISASDGHAEPDARTDQGAGSFRRRSGGEGPEPTRSCGLVRTNAGSIVRWSATACGDCPRAVDGPDGDNTLSQITR